MESDSLKLIKLMTKKIERSCSKCPVIKDDRILLGYQEIITLNHVRQLAN